MRVLFISMPFGAIRPALGVSLLKSHLAAVGIPSHILYLNLRFAQWVGYDDYKYVAELAPSQSLAGDWVFAQCLSGSRDENADSDYLTMFRNRFSSFRAPRPPIDILKRCRASAVGFLDDCIDGVRWDDYDMVGFTSTFTQHAASLSLAMRVKQRHPRLLIAFGGANCEDLMGLQTHRSFPFVDFVCSGEADLSFPQLVQTLRDGGDPAQIPGVIYRRRGESQTCALSPARVADMNALPYPDYDDYFEQLAALKRPDRSYANVLIESSRGCWWGEKHHCTFCGLNGTSMAFRSKRAERVLDEMTALVARYRPSNVEMVDNILDMSYFDSLLPSLTQKNLQLDLFYETKANLTKEQLFALHAAGIRTIQPGIESFSSSVLRLMRKGTTAVQNVQLLKWCKEIGIRVYWNMLYGFPGEDPADYTAAAELIGSLHHLQPPYGVGQIRLDRFSPHFFDAAVLGITNIKPDRSYRSIYGLAPDELANLAYYFEHDYADGRNPDSYTGCVHAAVVRWHEHSGSRGLVYADHGDTLALWDLRPGARRMLTILDGIDRAIYLHCDKNRSLAQVRSLAASLGAAPASADAFLTEMLADRLMLCLDARYLSLACAADPARAVRGAPSETQRARSWPIVSADRIHPSAPAAADKPDSR